MQIIGNLDNDLPTLHFIDKTITILLLKILQQKDYNNSNELLDLTNIIFLFLFHIIILLHY